MSEQATAEPAPSAPLPEGRYLIDNSVYARTAHPRIAPIWATALRADQLVSSGPFLIEALYSTRGPEVEQAYEELAEGLPLVMPDGETWGLVHGAQITMSKVSAEFHRRPAVDYLTAALAHQHGLGVLHYDGDYDLLAEHSGLTFASQWVVPRGTIVGVSSNPLRRFRPAIKSRLDQFVDPDDQAVFERVTELLDHEIAGADKQPLPPVEQP